MENIQYTEYFSLVSLTLILIFLKSGDKLPEIFLSSLNSAKHKKDFRRKSSFL